MLQQLRPAAFAVKGAQHRLCLGELNHALAGIGKVLLVSPAGVSAQTRRQPQREHQQRQPQQCDQAQRPVQRKQRSDHYQRRDGAGDKRRKDMRR